MHYKKESNVKNIQKGVGENERTMQRLFMKKKRMPTVDNPDTRLE